MAGNIAKQQGTKKGCNVALDYIAASKLYKQCYRVLPKPHI